MTGNGESTKPVENDEVDEESSLGTEPGPDASSEEKDEEPEPETEPEPEPEPETEPEPEPEPKDPVVELQEQLDKKQNQLLHVAADFENFKKRSRRDAKEAAFRARNELLQELLPLIDNVELALTHAADGAEGESDVDSLRKGVEMVLRQFQTTMNKYEVKSFDSLGEPFDPNFHEALQQRETDEHPPGVVMEEYRRGYLMGDRLIRPAMVVVAKAPANNEPLDQDDVSEDSASEKGDEQ